MSPHLLISRSRSSKAISNGVPSADDGLDEVELVFSEACFDLALVMLALHQVYEVNLIFSLQIAFFNQSFS